VVIFSGQKCSADDWILQYVEKHRTQDLLLVSSDRKLVMACQHYGAKHMPAPEFYGIMQEVLVHDIQAHTGVWGSSQELHKYRSRDYVFDDDEHEIDTKAVDMLMEQASTRVPDKDDDKKQEQPRKGNAQMLSKHEKKIVGTLKKLR
jgi:predicted RNA-binding protein with PIN domain